MKNKKVTWLVAAEICLLALLAAVIVLLANLITDIIYKIVDPRINFD